MKNGINTAEIGKKLMECSVFKAKILTKSSIKIANASLFEILFKRTVASLNDDSAKFGVILGPISLFAELAKGDEDQFT